MDTKIPEFSENFFFGGKKDKNSKFEGKTATIKFYDNTFKVAGVIRNNIKQLIAIHMNNASYNNNKDRMKFIDYNNDDGCLLNLLNSFINEDEM
jgi:hypothetical protein